MAAQHPPLDYSSCSSIFNSFSGPTNSPYSSTKRYSSHSQFSDDDINTVNSHESYTNMFPPLNHNPYIHQQNGASNNMNMTASFSPHLPSNSSYSISPDIHLSQSSRNSPQQNHQKHTFYDPEANVYVANLPSDYDKEQLFCLFSDCGKILRYKYVQNGYGFVQFSNRNDAHRAIKSLDGYTFPNGNVISLSIALNVAKDALSKEEPTNLYVKNVPSNWANNDLIKLFGNYGTIMQSKVVGDGTAFVRYKHHIEALSAIGDLDKKNLEFGLGRLEVRFATRKVASKAYTTQQQQPTTDGNACDSVNADANNINVNSNSNARKNGNDHDHVNDGNGNGNEHISYTAQVPLVNMSGNANNNNVNNNNMNMNPNNGSYQHHNINGRNLLNLKNLSNENNLYIKNLPKFYTQTNLEDLFRPFGEIWSVKVLDDGKGFVRFFYTEDALRAIKQLNGQKVPFSDEEIVVKLAHHDLNDDNIQVFEENRLETVRDWTMVNNNNNNDNNQNDNQNQNWNTPMCGEQNGQNITQMNGYIRNLHGIIENLRNENRQAISKLNQQQSYNVYLQNVNSNVMNVYRELHGKYEKLKVRRTQNGTHSLSHSTSATHSQRSMHSNEQNIASLHMASGANDALTLPVSTLNNINCVTDDSVSTWQVGDVVDWIADLDDNKFGKYKDRLNWSMNKENIDGKSLQFVEFGDLDRFGVDDIDDKMSLLKHIKMLLPEPMVSMDPIDHNASANVNV